MLLLRIACAKNCPHDGHAPKIRTLNVVPAFTMAHPHWLESSRGPDGESSSASMHADLKNPEYVAWKRFLGEAEHWTREQIAQYQSEQIQRIVRHAYEHTAGYRGLMESAGVTPDAIRCAEDVRKLPCVTKEDLRDRLEDFSAPCAGAEYVTTGGSTGIPFGFRRNPEAFARELASKAHQYHRIGWKEGDRQLVLRGLPIHTPDQTEYFPEFEELRCSSYHLTDEQMDLYYRRALEYQPQWLRCYPSAGHLFARYLQDRGLRIPSIKGVLCASENLYEFQRRLLQKVFGANVFSHYGHYELAVLAGFCESEAAYHVLPQYGYAELLDRDDRPVTRAGAAGEIVGTSFLMRATPFIRYRTRDFAVLKGFGCTSCGRPYQVWERIDGRLQEFILTGSGRLISMTAINMHDGTFDHVCQFQFHQAERGRVTLKYVPKKNCDGTSLAAMRERLMFKLGEDVELALQSVDSIPLTQRGKHRFLIQELRLEHGDA